jgi:4-alpha-glucanotransferase
MLPLCPAGAGNSPYDSPSANAISPLLISLEDLAAAGLIAKNDIKAPARLLRSKRVDFAQAAACKEKALRSAHGCYLSGAARGKRKGFERFCHEQSSWLNDYALFSALRAANGNKPWHELAKDLRDRKESAVSIARSALAREIEYHQFVQFVLDQQWLALRTLCQELGIQLVGDLPIYVAYDSADVWANRKVFCLDIHGRRKCVAGVPPDYFSKTGQLWGNPLYRWSELKKTDFAWWKQRMRVMLRRFDAVRLDRHMQRPHNAANMSMFRRRLCSIH